MSIEVLVSTMNQTDYSLIDKMNIQSDAVIVNQCNEQQVSIFYYKGYKITWICTTERGLSKSRNMAIQYAQADYCLLCDDDEVLCDGYGQIIEKGFSLFPKADIVAFDFEKINMSVRYLKVFEYGGNNSAKKAPYFKSYCSIRIAFRREKLIINDILFDERFGAGSGIISAGEETVWQVTARKKGMKIYHVPATIAFLNQQQSTWFSGLNRHYYYDLGACLVTNYPVLCHILKYYYIINIRGGTLSVAERLKWMKAGIHGFRSYQYSYEQYLEKCK